MIDARPLTEALYDLSCHFMPGGVNSPVRSFKSLEMTPLMIESGKGEKIIDVDGNTYLDFCQSWGALILGHLPNPVVQALKKQLEKGTSFGIATRLEQQLAEKIIYHLPSIERIRFVSSGTEATMTAIRLARGYTGKPKIIKFNGHFHGHSDHLLVQAGSGVTDLPQASSSGILEEVVRATFSLPFNEIETCRSFLSSRDDIAAILLEPIAGNMGVVPAHPSFLKMLREESEKRGIVLIFDEVITGFRVGLQGAQGLYGIQPDLTCLGKVIGGGLPAAAFGGKKELMDQIAPLGNVYQAGTLSGNPLAMTAGLATLNCLEEPLFFETLNAKTEQFLKPFREIVLQYDLPVAIQNVGSMFTFFFGVKKVEKKEDLLGLDQNRFKAFFKSLFSRGIYFSPSAYEAHFLSSAHTEESLKKAQLAIIEFLSSTNSRNPI